MEYEAIKAAMVSGEFKHASKMIERTFAVDSQFAEEHYLNLANWLLPCRTNSLLTGGWLHSLVQGCPAPL